MGYIGFHASIAGGIYNAVDEAVRKKAEALQIFTANQRMWKTKAVSKDSAARFRQKRKQAGLKAVVSHDSYLINPASVNPSILSKSRKGFEDEIKRASLLELDAVVFHPGSYAGGSFKRGVKNIVTSLNVITKKFPGLELKLLFETVAGAGSQIGGSFGELAVLINKLKNRGLYGVCFDTAHVFEAGYDIKNDYEGVFREFDRVIGLEKIKIFHVNDSKTPRNSKSDRHEHIGKGKIGRSFFEKLMKDRRFKTIPMLIETPGGKNMDAVNIKLLKKMRGAG